MSFTAFNIGGSAATPTPATPSANQYATAQYATAGQYGAFPMGYQGFDYTQSFMGMQSAMNPQYAAAAQTFNPMAAFAQPAMSFGFPQQAAATAYGQAGMAAYQNPMAAYQTPAAAVATPVTANYQTQNAYAAYQTPQVQQQQPQQPQQQQQQGFQQYAQPQAATGGYYQGQQQQQRAPAPQPQIPQQQSYQQYQQPAPVQQQPQQQYQQQQAPQQYQQQQQQPRQQQQQQQSYPSQQQPQQSQNSQYIPQPSQPQHSDMSRQLQSPPLRAPQQSSYQSQQGLSRIRPPQQQFSGSSAPMRTIPGMPPMAPVGMQKPFTMPLAKPGLIAQQQQLLGAQTRAPQVVREFTPVPQKPVIPSWVLPISKMNFPSWEQKERSVVDIASRFPGLRISPEFVKISCHYAPAGAGSPCPIPGPACITTNAEDKFKVSAKKESVAASPAQYEGWTYSVRVVLFSNSESIDAHPATRLQLLLLRTEEGVISLPGGDWVPADGANPSDDATLERTATRVVKESLNVDLASVGCKFSRYSDIAYLKDGTPSYVVVVVAALWNTSAKSAPLAACRLVEDELKEVSKTVIEDHPLTEEDVETRKKEFADRITKERADGMLSIRGEREADRVERLEKLEEKLHALQATGPQLPATKKVVKQVSEMQTIQHVRLLPVLVPLSDALQQNQGLLPLGKSFDGVFESKLIALCLNENFKKLFGYKITEWLKTYKEKRAADDAERSLKRKRDEEELAERQRALAEYAEKKKKYEEKKAAAVEGEEEEELPPAPKFKQRRIQYDVDETDIIPFKYYDTSLVVPCGSMRRDDLVSILHCCGDMCYREIQELVKPTTLPVPGVIKSAGGLFPYKFACSVEHEVEELPEVLPEATPEVETFNSESAPAAE